MNPIIRKIATMKIYNFQAFNKLNTMKNKQKFNIKKQIKDIQKNNHNKNYNFKNKKNQSRRLENGIDNNKK